MPSGPRSGGVWLAGHPCARLLAPHHAFVRGGPVRCHLLLTDPRLIRPAPCQPFRRAPCGAVPAPADTSVPRPLRPCVLCGDEGPAATGG